MALKPGPKPIAKSTGKPDQRRRDNKNTPGNTPGLKPSKSSVIIKTTHTNTGRFIFTKGMFNGFIFN